MPCSSPTLRDSSSGVTEKLSSASLCYKQESESGEAIRGNRSEKRRAKGGMKQQRNGGLNVGRQQGGRNGEEIEGMVVMEYRKWGR